VLQTVVVTFDSRAETDSLGHYCGIAGFWSRQGLDAGRTLFYMLFAQQHRGQEACGIAWDDGTILHSDRRLGMVAGAAESWLADGRQACCAIGHVRYATHGGSGLANAQPLAVSCNKGRIAIAHNGNLSNGPTLRQQLSSAGAIFQTTSDTEIFLHHISHAGSASCEAILREALAGIEGAYSLCMAWNGALVAARDPMGFRPLHLAEHAGVHYVASETCALRALGPLTWREIEPGECVIIDADGTHSFFLDRAAVRARCIFELIYFARPDSYVFGRSVYAARRRLGEAMAERDERNGFKPDVVVPVPDSGTLAAMGYADRAAVPFDFGLTRNHYAGRSFILPTKGERELAVRMKLHAVEEVVSGRCVAIVDDSLVRGTTSGIIIRLLKEAGAREVHLRLSSPELCWPCYYGIDIPTREELVSNRLDACGIAAMTGADTVRFLPVDVLRGCLAAPDGEYCCACFDGQYPCPPR
jgi:amidophosphoribosyltransferase